MRRPTAACSESGISLVEMIVGVAIVLILSAGVVLMMGSSKETGAQKVSLSKLEEARTAMQRARDREQATLGEILPAGGSLRACAGVNPLPRVAELGGSCRAAWDAVNTALAPYVGSAAAAAELMTDGAKRPILVETREAANCAVTPNDRLVSVHPSGDRAKPVQELELGRSGYGC